MPEILSCETCVYGRERSSTADVAAWDYTTGDRKVVPHTWTWIECRRYPPTVVVEKDVVQQHYPMVQPDDLCGEWSATFK